MLQKAIKVGKDKDFTSRSEMKQIIAKLSFNNLFLNSENGVSKSNCSVDKYSRFVTQYQSVNSLLGKLVRSLKFPESKEGLNIFNHVAVLLIVIKLLLQGKKQFR